MLRKCAIAAAFAALPCTAFAQAPAPAPDSGDTAWILASSALVLLMTLPGLGGTGHPGGLSSGAFFVAQALGVAVTALWSAVVTAVAALAVSLFLPMRVSEDDERQGLDIASHGERGWEFD